EKVIEDFRLLRVFGQPDLAAVLLLIAALGSVQAHAYRAGMPDAAELVDAADAPIRHLEEGRFVAEGVAVAIEGRVEQAILVGIHKALAGDVGHMRPGHGDDQAGRVRGIVHRRRTGALPPLRAETPLRDLVQSVIEIVIVLRLAVDDAPEIAPAEALAAVERARVIVARLAEHVGFAGRKNGLEE